MGGLAYLSGCKRKKTTGAEGLYFIAEIRGAANCHSCGAQTYKTKITVAVHKIDLNDACLNKPNVLVENK